MPGDVLLPAQIPLGGSLVLGAMLLGIGATINQGCFLGSVSQLGRGNPNYLFTLLGIALALAWGSPGERGPLDLSEMVLHIRLARSNDPAALLFVPFALFGAARFFRARRQAMLALIGAGISGGIIYALNPDWSYTSLLGKLVNGQFQATQWNMGVGTASMFGGAALSSVLAQTYHWRPLTLRQSVGCLLGGLFMGIGAILVPGGNDGLMLWSIPGLALYGPVAYFVMIITIAAMMYLAKKLSIAPQSAFQIAESDSAIVIRD